ncbi:MAG: hypothetical protein ACM3YE_01185 [Bacteroidota bacterium]|jgi:hypothetical protein
MPQNEIVNKLNKALDLIDKQIALYRAYYSIKECSPGGQNWDIWLLFYDRMNGPLRREMLLLREKIKKNEPVSEKWLKDITQLKFITEITKTPEHEIEQKLRSKLNWENDIIIRDVNRTTRKVNQLHKFLEVVLGHDPERDRDIYFWLAEYLPMLQDIAFDKIDSNRLGNDTLKKLSEMEYQLEELRRRFEEYGYD